ncbi:ATP-binding protein [Oleisolibacter albus]|uniref:ATP-binding protein n=1 Tax=Oleisolibacter albus TaxID=2171757 RepID=UPI000DF2DCC3|nr:winged helix-turn-helix domain-containing protein [Oleisolibacter albus]
MSLRSDSRFLLDAARRRLLRDGTPVPLGDRAFDLLLSLAAADGRAVTVEDLTDRVWPGLTVGAGNLRVQVRALRRVLGNDAVENVPGIGYRLALSLDRTGRTPLPAADDLLGRSRDMARLDELLDHSRLVSIIGPGGVGKTALALAALATRAGQDGVRVAHVELAPVRQPGLVAVATAAVLAAKLLGPDIIAAIQTALADQPTLLLLDNAEHLLDEVGDFAEGLLGACPGVRLLLTSREPLNISGELLLHLCPLDCPPDGPLSAAEIRRYPAVQLVLHRHALGGWLSLPDEDLPALARLCRQLDGLPLALVLLAAQLRDCGVEAAAQALDGRFQDLPLPDTVEYHHGSLSRMLDWSLDLLPEADRLLLGRLTVFSGLWQVQAAAQVCGGPPLDPATVPGLVAGLVARSLIAGPVQTQQSGLRMLETIRQYMTARSHTRLEQEDLQRRLVRWLTVRLREIRSTMASTGSIDPRTIPDLADIFAATDWALRGGDVTGGQILAIDALKTLCRDALYPQAARILIQARDGGGDATPRAVRAMLDLLLHGEAIPIRLPFHADRPRFTRNELDPILAVLRQTPDLPVTWQIDALTTAGWLKHYAGDFDGRHSLWMDGVAVAERSGFWHDQASIVSLLGWTSAGQGDFVQARAYFVQAQALAEQHGLRRKLLLLRYADMEFMAGELDRAIAITRDAIALDEQAVPALMQTLHANLASYLLLADRTQEAVPQALAALRLTLRHQYAYAHAWTLERGALLALRLGHRDLALSLACLGQALVPANDLSRSGPELAIHTLLAGTLGELHPAIDQPSVDAVLTRLADVYEAAMERAPSL